MRPGKGASRPSILAIQPNNPELSAGRRVKLLAAFDSLPEDDRADFLELVESISGQQGTLVSLTDKQELRHMVEAVWKRAGW